MKNIQVIDGAQNTTFSIFQATDDEFALLFPEPRQDLQYADHLLALPQQEAVTAALSRILGAPHPEAGRPRDPRDSPLRA